MGYVLGKNCITKILVNGNWVNWGTIREQAINRSADTVDVDCRDGDGRSENARNFGADAPIGHTVEVTQTVKTRKDDVALNEIIAKSRVLGTIEAKIGDGGIGLGVDGVFQVTSYKETQTLKDVVVADITLSLVEYKDYT